MSDGSDGFAEKRALISPLSSDYYHGASVPIPAPVSEIDSDQYALERSSISSVLIARTTDAVVEETDSTLGYRFKAKPPSKVKTNGELQRWVQATSHEALDGLVATDLQIGALANRYEDLAMPHRPLGQTSRLQTRRQTLMFQQAVSEPHALLRIGSIAANYNGLRISRTQALPYLVTALKDMQGRARRDMARQDVRSAILEAVDTMGTMLTPEDEEASARYALLRAFVASQTGHILMANSFGDLYDIQPDDNSGITITERDEGFGDIKPKREVPIVCPATYRFADSLDDIARKPSALYRLLRAGITALDQKDLFGESLAVRRTALPTARAQLERSLVEANKPPLNMAA